MQMLIQSGLIMFGEHGHFKQILCLILYYEIVHTLYKSIINSKNIPFFKGLDLQPHLLVDCQIFVLNHHCQEQFLCYQFIFRQIIKSKLFVVWKYSCKLELVCDHSIDLVVSFVDKGAPTTTLSIINCTFSWQIEVGL